MGFTLVEKLLMKNTKLDQVISGEIITVTADRVMIHDLFAPFVIRKFHEMGFKKIWDLNKIIMIFDHMVPNISAEDCEQHAIINKFILDSKIKHVHYSDGVCHQIMPEKRYVQPGNIVLGTDSHSTTYGSIGSFATGIGYTEMASVLGTGNLWIKTPRSIRVNIDGNLNKGVYSKDIILKIIGDIKSNGATGAAIEFTGNTIKDMSISSRMTLSNMSVEAGAEAGLIAPDKKTYQFSGAREDDLSWLYSDKNAKYDKVLEYHAEVFEPMIACPSTIDNVKAVSQIENIELEQCYLGSCTNGRLEDLRVAASILKGKKVFYKTRLLVCPASRYTYEKAAAQGILDVLIQAGATIHAPSCGLCCGRGGGMVGDYQRVLSSSNRNFLGRMGSKKSEIYIASPATVAASAVAGKIVDPREYL